MAKMKKRKLRNPAIVQQHGYALLLVVFLTAMILVSALAVAPDILTQSRREKEEEMIWRGKQYVRAISLYRRKTGHFPSSLDDLAKGQPGVHFLRKLYKDPVNKADGTWRLIFVGPSGQLIGSLNPRSVTGSFPVAANPAALNSATAPASAATSSAQNSNPAAQPGSATPPDPAANPSAASSQPGASDLPPGNIPDTGPTFGGSIVGVGSKIDHKSVITYNKAHNYRLFEFIWDPIKELNASAVPGVSGQALSDPSFKPLPAPADPTPAHPVSSPPVDP